MLFSGVRVPLQLQSRPPTYIHQCALCGEQGKACGLVHEACRALLLRILESLHEAKQIAVQAATRTQLQDRAVPPEAPRGSQLLPEQTIGIAGVEPAQAGEELVVETEEACQQNPVRIDIAPLYRHCNPGATARSEGVVEVVPASGWPTAAPTPFTGPSSRLSGCKLQSAPCQTFTPGLPL